jgi:glycosyltransferase involved in cell wall biosynthesis
VTESRPKNIGFYTEGVGFDGRTPTTKALGGSETALVQAARALAARGHGVTVFNNCSKPACYDEVQYLPLGTFPAQAARSHYDVFIVSRFFGFLALPFEAGLKVLWNHDILDNPQALRQVIDRLDLMFVLSRFQRDNYLTRLPRFNETSLIVTRNGVDLELIDDAARGTVRNPSKIIYASRPERGLRVLLESIWPVLLSTRPDLELYLCGYEMNRTKLAPGLAELYDYLDRLVERTPRVVPLGALPKGEYYRHLCESALMIYPCTFPEISCIAALEAQACRTPVLTTNSYALAETVAVPEFLVKGRAGTPDYNRDFIKQALWLLESAETAALVEQARTRMENHYTWPVITAQWDRIFDLHLISKLGQNSSRCTYGRDGHDFTF